MNYGRELLKGSTDSLLLSLINNEPMYGYKIIKEMEKRSGGFFCFKEGTLYPALHRMEESGLIEGKWQKAPGGQERRYYYITQKGRQAFTERLEVWRGFATAVNAIMEPILT
jgi:PadR family transcriptional regulator, regulatory protein PadR